VREPDLFGDTGELDERGGPGRADGHDQGGRDEAESAHAATAPLAARMRPRSLAEFHGQRHLLAEGRTLRSMIATGRPSSMILWGPPGSGKTTLARILAAETGHRFVPLSAVTDGVARLREIVREARTRLEATGLRTIVFCDEIHRFNKAQQDAFLPHVEAGTVILVGATTENPSFEVVRPLLSRAPVLVLEPLSVEELRAVLVDALRDETRLGLEVIRSGETVEGATRFAQGAGRHGAFE